MLFCFCAVSYVEIHRQNQLGRGCQIRLNSLKKEREGNWKQFNHLKKKKKIILL